MKALFVDFEDSFSYNVVQELFDVGVDADVVNWGDFSGVSQEYDVLIFGPGPGHPDDYQNLFPILKSYLAENRPFFGICLGHQIFWRTQGEDVFRSKNPVHGQKVELDLTQEWKEWLGIQGRVFVQRYNSLAVFNGRLNPLFKNFVQDDELMITRGEKVITYQFHPESVGTTFRKEFMQAIYSIVNE